MVNVADRLTPCMQWTRTLPVTQVNTYNSIHPDTMHNKKDYNLWLSVEGK